MVLEQFLHETRFFSIVHLYFDEQQITFLDHAKKEHPPERNPDRGDTKRLSAEFSGYRFTDF